MPAQSLKAYSDLRPFGVRHRSERRFRMEPRGRIARFLRSGFAQPCSRDLVERDAVVFSECRETQTELRPPKCHHNQFGSCGSKSLAMSPTVFHRVSTERSALARRSALSFEKAFSIRLKSGL